MGSLHGLIAFGRGVALPRSQSSACSGQSLFKGEQASHGKASFGDDKMGIALPYFKVTFGIKHLKRRSWAWPTSRRLELCVGDVLLIQLCKPSMA